MNGHVHLVGTVIGGRGTNCSYTKGIPPKEHNKQRYANVAYHKKWIIKTLRGITNMSLPLPTEPTPSPLPCGNHTTTTTPLPCSPDTTTPLPCENPTTTTTPLPCTTSPEIDTEVPPHTHSKEDHEIKLKIELVHHGFKEDSSESSESSESTEYGMNIPV